MPENISKRTLLVVSDTPAKVIAGVVNVYEPVLREMQMLLTLFDEIIWLTCDAGIRKYAVRNCSDSRLNIVVMPSVYNSRFNWLFSIIHYPVFLFYILKYLDKAKYVHTRGPSHPALLAILMSLADTKRKYWHKYAGNWEGKKLPLAYRLQKQLLKTSKKNFKATINGNEKQLPHILSFENPCFTNSELNTALQVAAQKQFDKELSLLFVGNLYHAKGVLNLLAALKSRDLQGQITRCYIVGNGPLYDEIKLKAQEIKNIEVVVTGALTRHELNKYYERCHLLVLPSLSEGFPKVIAEAAAYGCIPVVTGLSVIPNYIQTGINGYLLNDNSPESIQHALQALTGYDLQKMSRNVTTITPRFTYEYYLDRIRKEVYHLAETNG